MSPVQAIVAWALIVSVTIGVLVLVYAPLVMLARMWFAYHPVSICIGVCP